MAGLEVLLHYCAEGSEEALVEAGAAAVLADAMKAHPDGTSRDGRMASTHTHTRANRVFAHERVPADPHIALPSPFSLETSLTLSLTPFLSHVLRPRQVQWRCCAAVCRLAHRSDALKADLGKSDACDEVT